MRAIPLERILLETDAPYMATAPTKVRGLLLRVARVRQLPPALLRDVLRTNAARVLPQLI